MYLVIGLLASKNLIQEEDAQSKSDRVRSCSWVSNFLTHASCQTCLDKHRPIATQQP